MANVTFSRPELMGAEELPPGVSKAGYNTGVEYFNAAITVIEEKSKPLVLLLNTIGGNKDKIISALNAFNKKYPYTTQFMPQHSFGSRYEKKNYEYVFRGDYEAFIRARLLEGISTLSSIKYIYNRLTSAKKDLQTMWNGSVANVFYNGPGITPKPIYETYPDAVKSDWFKGLTSSIFGTHGFQGKATQIVDDLMYAIERLAMGERVSWPRNLDLPALGRLKKAQDVVKVVEAQQQAQRQSIGIDLGRPDIPIVIPKFTFPTVVQDDEPKWLMPALIGGGALLTFAALKG
jgi:hypothetical protein